MHDPGPYYRPTGMAYAPRPRRIPWVPIVIGGILAGVALLLLVIVLFPSWFGLSSPAYPYRFGLGGAFLAFFVLIVVFFIVRVAFWSARASRYGRRYGGSSSEEEYRRPNRPAMIARMRYARGEITRDQYDQIMKDLGRRPGSP